MKMDNNSNAQNENQEPVNRRPVVPVEIPTRISVSPDAGVISHDGVRTGSLSARRPQSARARGQRPNSARASTHSRMYSLPAGAAIPAYHPHGFYHQVPQTVRTSGHYVGAENGEYASAGGVPAAWHTGMAPVPVFGPWGYDMGWGPHPSSPAGMYGVCMMGSPLSRRSEKATRMIFVGELPPSLGEAEVQELAAKFGSIRAFDMTQREITSGVFVSYYNIRQAEAAVRGLPEAVSAAVRTGLEDDQPSRVIAYFMLPPVGVAGMENQGIVAVSSAEEELSSSKLKSLFSEFGELKSLTKVGTEAGGCHVVEFFDTRDAERAVAELKWRKPQSAGWNLEYAPFAGLEPTCQQPYQTYPFPTSYMPSGGVKHEDTSIREGMESSSSAPSRGMWSMESLSAHGPTPYGWAPFPMPAHHSSFGSDSGHPVGASAALAINGPSAELPPTIGDTVAAAYGPPQSCRTDYYSAPQYMGYPNGMAAMMPFGQPLRMMPSMGMYDGVGVGLHGELPKSPGRATSGGEPHSWRPHRTGRGAGERNYDPAQFEFSLDEAHMKSVNARTTLMIRNIPNKYSQKMLLDVLDKKYSGRYDFFYLPIDFKNRCNLGYAFVNFKNASTTAEFYKEFHSKSWEEFNSKKVCEITYARVQGCNALIEHFRNSRFPCNEPDCLPLVFEPVEEGVQGKKTNGQVMKATPVHHWTSMNYPNNPPVAAH